MHREFIYFLGALSIVLVSACEDGSGDGSDLAQPVTIGPEPALLVPNSTVTCADGFPIQINASFPQPFNLQGSPSCTIVTYSNVQPTTAGRIVGATIGVGPITGPMRFVRLRILEEQSTGPACCSAEQVGDVFTPTPNGLTDVPLDFDMIHQVDEETRIVSNDWIGLEVLAPDVPIPGVWTANGGADITLPDYEWFPALGTRSALPTLNLRSEGSFSGFVPTFNVRFAAAR